jgi:Tfp pilus assembly protein PilF
MNETRTAMSTSPVTMARHRSAPDSARRRPAFARLAIALLGAALIGMLAVLPEARGATSDPTPSDPAWLVAARQELRSRQFEAALATLRKAGDTSSAEWHNLMGYTLRSGTPPDLATAEIHYRKALELEPRHRSALEYYGELLLMKNDLAGAEAMLERLNKACRFGCEELRDLRAAIARHKAARK